ncbi:MAG TPA: flagellar export protein FliJ [Syntrophomonadaceae bacterium]|jgi:flagellar FliJ protein|nr:flagellar export protein FliJ [Syntrophomonadaceae bacterium]
MKPFVFRLQTKLDVVNLEEDLVRQELKHHLEARDKVQFALEEIVDEIQQVENSLVQMMQGTVSLDKMLLMRNYLPVLSESRQLKEQELRQAEQTVEEVREQLVSKRKECRVLEKLKERDWHEYKQEWQRQEQKVLDEVAANNHYRSISRER